jgi:urea carboxylase
VFQVSVEVGQVLRTGDRVLVLDAMKTEIAVATAKAGTVVEILCAPGTLVYAGQTLLVIRPE